MPIGLRWLRLAYGQLADWSPGCAIAPSLSALSAHYLSLFLFNSHLPISSLLMDELSPTSDPDADVPLCERCAAIPLRPSDIQGRIAHPDAFFDDDHRYGVYEVSRISGIFDDTCELCYLFHET